MKNNTTELTDRKADMPMATKRPFMKEKLGSFGTRPKSEGISSFFIFRRTTTSRIIRRTTVTDVNIEMTMPSIMVTAKPLTGPEPNANSSTVPESVVTLESMMVA
ncbi:hypothetical protein D9M70_578880 [compost metagenome]